MGRRFRRLLKWLSQRAWQLKAESVAWKEEKDTWAKMSVVLKDRLNLLMVSE